MIYFCFHLEKLTLSAVWRTWDYRVAGWIHRDQTDSSVLMNDDAGELGQRSYDGHGEMRMDSSDT